MQVRQAAGPELSLNMRFMLSFLFLSSVMSLATLMLVSCNAYCEATNLYVQACLTCRDYITGLLHLLLGCGRHNNWLATFAMQAYSVGG